MNDPDPAQLEGLLRLQDAEQTVRRLRHQLDHLPEQQALDQATEELEEVARQHDALRVEADRLASEARRIEQDIAMLRERHAAETQRLYSGDISNPRELQDLRRDAEATERRIGEHEDRLLEVMEQQEALAARMARLAAERGRLEEVVAERARARDAAAADLLAQLEAAERVRDAERAALSEELLARYDAVAARHGGVAVGRLEGDLCTACRLSLPRAEVSALREGPPLGTCPECGRLLVVL